MWDKIVNPKTRRRVNINSKIGQTVLNNYLAYLNLTGGDRVSLGEGAHGSVYYETDNPNVVIKRQRDTRACEMWENEFLGHRKVYDQWNQLIITGPEFIKKAGKFINVTQPIQFNNIDKWCEIKSERVCSQDSEKLFHTAFGHDDIDINNVGMGIIKGYKQLSQLLGKHFNEFINSLGIFIGFLHYSPILEFTGNDLEYVFAKSCGSSNRPIIYVLDFGEALGKITSIDDITYSMTLSLHSYPVSNDEFWKGYLSIAKYFDKLDLAKEVEKEIRE